MTISIQHIFMTKSNKKTQNPFKTLGIASHIEKWNSQFPYDYMWRKKYNIAFGSEIHRGMDFFDIKFDILEQQYVDSINSVQKDDSQDKQLFKNKVIENNNSMSQEEFDSIDLDDVVIK